MKMAAVPSDVDTALLFKNRRCAAGYYPVARICSFMFVLTQQHLCPDPAKKHAIAVAVSMQLPSSVFCPVY
jgi:hypothetical protein